MLPFVFATPSVLLALGIIPVMITWYAWQHRNQQTTVRLSTAGGFHSSGPGLKIILRHLLFAFRLIACALLIIAAARPQFILSKQMIRSEGIDIMLVLDVSGSMLTKDFVPNRLEASKTIAAKFIDGRPNDRIGIVVFAAQSYTASPVTIDHESLKTIIKGIEPGTLAYGTAIGSGLGTAISRLQSSNGKSKVIILMTDGSNNAGNILPDRAAQLAASNAIRIYAIGMEPYQGISLSEREDKNLKLIGGPSAEELLTEIAGHTGGQYFHAMDEKNLASVYEEIDRMEKTRVDITSYRENSEAFFPFALLAVFLIITELILRYTVFRTA